MPSGGPLSMEFGVAISGCLLSAPASVDRLAHSLAQHPSFASCLNSLRDASLRPFSPSDVQWVKRLLSRFLTPSTAQLPWPFTEKRDSRLFCEALAECLRDIGDPAKLAVVGDPFRYITLAYANHAMKWGIVPNGS